MSVVYRSWAGSRMFALVIVPSDDVYVIAAAM
jgi:hypothetical protein